MYSFVYSDYLTVSVPVYFLAISYAVKDSSGGGARLNSFVAEKLLSVVDYRGRFSAALRIIGEYDDSRVLEGIGQHVSIAVRRVLPGRALSTGLYH